MEVLQKPFSKGELIATLKLIGITTEKAPEKEEGTITHKEQESKFYNLDIIHSFLGTNEWRTGSTPAGDIEIPAGGAIMINRKSLEGSFSWVKTQPF